MCFFSYLLSVFEIMRLALAYASVMGGKRGSESLGLFFGPILGI
jgi:hypothetical protein